KDTIRGLSSATVRAGSYAALVRPTAGEHADSVLARIVDLRERELVARLINVPIRDFRGRPAVCPRPGARPKRGPAGSKTLPADAKPVLRDAREPGAVVDKARGHRDLAPGIDAEPRPVRDWPRPMPGQLLGNHGRRGRPCDTGDNRREHEQRQNERCTA